MRISQMGRWQTIILPTFSENFMKMKKMGQGKGCSAKPKPADVYIPSAYLPGVSPHIYVFCLIFSVV